MANLLYRASTSATPPGSTTAKLARLTNLEIDGNFKSLDNDIQTRATTAGVAATVATLATTAALATAQNDALVYAIALG